MAMDLIISDTGHVMIASNAPFEADVVRVDLLATKKLLMLNYADGGPEVELLNLEVHDQMMSALMQAPSILVVEVAQNALVRGFDVPLVQTDFTLE